VIFRQQDRLKALKSNALAPADRPGGFAMGFSETALAGYVMPMMVAWDFLAFVCRRTVLRAQALMDLNTA
jgi:hypothetical protein